MRPTVDQRCACDARVGAAQQLDEQRMARQVALGAAALERELAGALRPALAFAARAASSCGTATSSKKTSLKCTSPARSTIGPHRDAGALSGRSATGSARRAASRRSPVRTSAIIMCAWCACVVHTFWPLRRQPSPCLARRACAPRPGRSRRPARSCRCRRSTRRARCAGRKRSALRLAAVAQQRRAALAVGDPVRADRRAGGEQLLEHHVALERAALARRRSGAARSCRSSRARRACG